ncbi:MAG: penicillin-binding protein activator [Rudaea sp.]|uniref:penicillin-binding protein activator n=1 Tax=unclassified Rudaea TaxID=2627037 RepID=UPI0010FA49CD|nr:MULTISPECIES: penicillin-binding protein activator [unclassified Rudaea]MBN8887340.1 penicillin-binding protein activator [Rudaea sp.]
MRTTSRASRLLFAAIGLAFLLAGCAELGTTGNSDNVPAATDAEHWYKNGEFDRAGRAFMDIADNDREYRDHYRLRAAEAFREEGNLNAVAWALDGVKARRLPETEQPRLDLLEAEVALSKKDAQRALTLLTFDDSALPRPLRLRAFELRARAQALTGDALGSARTRLALNPSLQGKDREQNEAQIVATLASLGAETLKQQGTSLLPGDALRAYIDQALRSAGQALPQTIDQPGQPVGTLGAGQAVNGEGYRPARAIALLLPIEGQLKAVAQPVRDGVFAAYFSDTHTPRPELRVYDAGNSAADAVAAYQRAIAEGADRVIGPLRRDAVSAVFAQNPLPAPVLALNLPERGETPPPGSAAFGLNPDTEGAQAAQHLLDRGITHAAIIAADTDWAERAAAAFRAQFEAGHGSILGETRLKSGELNFSANVRSALAGLPAQSIAAPPPTTPAPADTASFANTGVFISMLPQQARLLVPQIKLAGYANLPIFATSHIFGGLTNPGMDRDLDGVEFCDAPWLFDAVVGLPKHGDVANSLESARGAGARLFAMGMDAYALAPYLDWMSQRRDAYLPGATGQLSNDGSGRIQRLLTWARFADGVATPVSGSLTISNPPTP